MEAYSIKFWTLLEMKYFNSDFGKVIISGSLVAKPPQYTGSSQVSAPVAVRPRPLKLMENPESSLKARL